MIQLNKDKDAKPLYLQLKDIITRDILDGTYKPGEQIPTEPEFQEKYDISRTTVRQAINELQTEGFVTRYRGIGTIVTKTKILEESMSRIKSFTDEIIELGGRPSTFKAVVRKVIAPLEVKEHFKLNGGEYVYEVYRVRGIDEIPMVIFQTYFPSNFDLPLDPTEYSTSLYDMVNRLNNKFPLKASEALEAQLASNEVAKELKMEENQPILLRTRKSFDQLGEPFEYTISYYNGNLYKYSFELA